MGGEGSGGCMTLVFLFDLGFRFSSGIFREKKGLPEG